MPNQNNAARRSRLIRAVAALLMLGTAMPAKAFDPAVTDEINFQVNCYFLMWTDPAKHVEVCNPQPIPTITNSLSDSGGSAGLPPAPTPPVPPVEEDDDECPSGQEPTPCGCAYPEA
ncbi:hypothetical protein [Devosia sp. XK-2]|uniref:hypothetical protein n=1 Tax=Devosia sp. XK-2 TaxID=3126689 RepID=UPI0030D11165